MSVTAKTYANYVGGEWVDGLGDGTMPALNPATGETIAEVPAGTEADVDRAVAAAVKGQAKWASYTPGQRARKLLQLADLIDANRDELADDRVAERGQAAAERAPRDGRLRRQPALLRRRRARCSRARPPASTSAATRPGSGASRSASSARSRPGTTR